MLTLTWSKSRSEEPIFKLKIYQVFFFSSNILTIFVQYQERIHYRILNWSIYRTEPLIDSHDPTARSIFFYFIPDSPS
uniref:ORF77 n=1 Tax=Pinus koraiensis TaxID=88728 RepID=A4QMG2_PINKO|nr:ORF77 [Pinus koraiensis]ABP35499.1 ORF77 [Pinus koraiensis]